jgi:hypothetical protein
MCNVSIHVLKHIQNLRIGTICFRIKLNKCGQDGGEIINFQLKFPK